MFTVYCCLNLQKVYTKLILNSIQCSFDIKFRIAVPIKVWCIRQVSVVRFIRVYSLSKTFRAARVRILIK